MRLGRATGSGFFEAPMLQLVCLEMCEEAGVRLMLHTYFVDLLMEDGFVRHALFVNKGGLVAVEAKQCIDATIIRICAADGHVVHSKDACETSCET